MIQAIPHIAEMDAYSLADLTAPPGKRLVSLSQNESIRPPSPRAIDAATQASHTQHLYPDPDWKDLRQALGCLHGIDPELIACGNGSLDLIGCLARAFLDRSCAALAPAHAYPFFRTATLATGARFDIAAEAALTADIENIVAALRPDTRIVFVANPGNPTGTRIPCRQLTQLRDAIPPSVMLVIDEAYGEFADHLGESNFKLVERGNTVVLRTFSKAYGLAGARIGWGLFPPNVLGQVRKLLNPNNAGACSQAAAVAALKDQSYMRDTCEQTAPLRDVFCHRIRELGLIVPESFTNFALIQFPSANAAQSADTYLRAEGLFLRAQSGAGLPDCLRATIGATEDMEVTVKLLATWINEESNK